MGLTVRLFTSLSGGPTDISVDVNCGTMLVIEGVLEMTLRVVVEVTLSGVSEDFHMEDFIGVSEAATGTFSLVVIDDLDDWRTVDD